MNFNRAMGGIRVTDCARQVFDIGQSDGPYTGARIGDLMPRRS